METFVDDFVCTNVLMSNFVGFIDKESKRCPTILKQADIFNSPYEILIAEKSFLAVQL